MAPMAFISVLQPNTAVTGRIVYITKYQLGTSGGRTHGVV